LSLELSPLAVLTDIERRIERLQNEIANSVGSLFVVPVEQKQLDDRGVERVINQVERAFARDKNSEVESANNIRERQIRTLQDQLPLLEADITAKREIRESEGFQAQTLLDNLVASLQNLSTPQTPSQSVLLPPGESLEFNLDSILKPQQDNTVRNILIAVIIGGILL